MPKLWYSVNLTKLDVEGKRFLASLRAERQRCVRCGGWLFLELLIEGVDIVCGNCGWRRSDIGAKSRSKHKVGARRSIRGGD